jgi:hypothetical protein
MKKGMTASFMGVTIHFFLQKKRPQASGDFYVVDHYTLGQSAKTTY